MKIKIFKVDAFTMERFSGNPAAVCILDEWLSTETMQKIAEENNLSETAFVVKKDKEAYQIRWFTPHVEVDLCGHATLASAYVLFNKYNADTDTIEFYSHTSGNLSVTKTANGLLELNFPADIFHECALPCEIVPGLNTLPVECYRGKTDYLLIYNSQKDIEELVPDFNDLIKVDGRGIIVTAIGDISDFVSRFFAPQVGINEDPVTGSAHTTLTPFWAKRLNKTTLKAIQLSKRKGFLECTYKNDRVLIAGAAVLFLQGEIII